jgi:hypothetical protein
MFLWLRWYNGSTGIAIDRQNQWRILSITQNDDFGIGGLWF